MLFSGRSLRYGAIVALIGVSFLAGCGGGDSDPAPVVSASPGAGTSVSRATVRVRVTFPRTVNAENYAQSVSIALADGKNYVQYGTVARPQGGGTAEYVFENAPVGDLSLKALSYPPMPSDFQGDNYTPDPISAGAEVLTNRAGAGTTLNITLEPVYDRIAVSALDRDVEVGENVSILAVGKNAAGDDVLIDPQKWEWSVADPSSASVLYVGRREGIATAQAGRPGTVEIRATDTQTGKSAALALPVLKQAPTLVVRNGASIAQINSRKPKRLKSYSISVGATPVQRLALTSYGQLLFNNQDRIQSFRTDIDIVSDNYIPVDAATDAVLGLPGGRVLAHNALGFVITDPRTSSVESKGLLKAFPVVQDMTLGPDGKIYLSAVLPDGRNVLARIALGADNSLTQEAVLRTETNALFSSLRFLSDGKLAALDQNTGTIQLYNVGSTTAEPVASAFCVGSGARRFTTGRGIFAEGDEILYVATRDGIKRFSYSNGSFTALEQEGDVFYPNDANTTLWQDVVIVPSK